MSVIVARMDERTRGDMMRGAVFGGVIEVTVT
jgi:hypothetical protein